MLVNGKTKVMAKLIHRITKSKTQLAERVSLKQQVNPV